MHFDRTATADADSEAEILRRALDLIHDIRTVVRSRPRKGGHGFGKETAIRRGALMKMLQQNALTLPLFIPTSEDDSPPALCGSVTAEPNYVAKVVEDSKNCL